MCFETVFILLLTAGWGGLNCRLYFRFSADVPVWAHLLYFFKL
jgi:hypothetical protein